MAKKNRQNIQKNRARSKQRVAARRKQHKKAHTSVQPFLGVGRQAIRAAPIHEALVHTALFEVGIGQLVVSRALGGGMLAVSIFLLDVYSLGVKDSYVRVVSLFDYDDLRRRLSGAGVTTVDPAYARKLLDDALAYARGLGFEPRGRYADACVVTDGIDASACTETFTFGHDGKPFYISGPNDSPAFVKQVTETLEAACGKDGFHVMIGGPVEYGDENDEEDEDDGDDDEWEDAEVDADELADTLIDDFDDAADNPQPDSAGDRGETGDAAPGDENQRGWLKNLGRMFKRPS